MTIKTKNQIAWDTLKKKIQWEVPLKWIDHSVASSTRSRSLDRAVAFLNSDNALISIVEDHDEEISFSRATAWLERTENGTPQFILMGKFQSVDHAKTVIQEHMSGQKPWELPQYRDDFHVTKREDMRVLLYHEADDDLLGFWVAQNMEYDNVGYGETIMGALSNLMIVANEDDPFASMFDDVDDGRDPGFGASGSALSITSVCLRCYAEAVPCVKGAYGFKEVRIYEGVFPNDEHYKERNASR